MKTISPIYSYYKGFQKHALKQFSLISCLALLGGNVKAQTGTSKEIAVETKTATITGEYKGPKPTPAQLAWGHDELGVVFHYDLHVFDGKPYKQSYNRRHPQHDPNIFNPTKLDTDQWALTAKNMGARFAILTASHETGFCLWQSDANPDFSLKAVEWGEGKRDIVAEFVASCRKHGIKPGIYLGTRWNSHLGFLDFKPTKDAKITLAEYNKMIEGEVEEICSRYGDLYMLWFDGGAHGPEAGGPDVLGSFEKHQKNGLFYHSFQRADFRWGGSESGTVPYPCWATMPFKESFSKYKKLSFSNNFRLLRHGDPKGNSWMPAMSDAPFRSRTHDWFWSKDRDDKISSTSHLVNCYYNSVGRNSTLIMGLVVDNRGLVPEADAKRCKKWGDAMKHLFSNKLGSSSFEGVEGEISFATAQEIDQLVFREKISEGERVREFSVDAWDAGTKSWSMIYTGKAIGNKHIVRLNKKVTSSKLRLRITKSTAKPLMSEFSAYFSDHVKYLHSLNNKAKQEGKANAKNEKK